MHSFAGEVIAIRNGHEVELLSHPAVLGEAAILAAEIATCRTYPCTLRAVWPLLDVLPDSPILHAMNPVSDALNF
jgi:hypothetical protein